jgi:NTE family protein
LEVKMQERALVLGGGGPVGISWEVGLAAGLAERGVDVRRADWMLGTSAGAFIGAQLATGIEPAALAELHLAVAREPGRQNSPGDPPSDDLFAFMQRAPRDQPPPPTLLAAIGEFALQAKTIPERDFVARFTGMFGPAGWPARFACSAVDARSGAFKVWSGADGVEIERGVAASCSVPGILPPIALRESFWIDGGVRSWNNADCAAGYRRVLIVAVVVPEQRALIEPVLEREQRAIEAAGGTSLLIAPDADSLAVFGPNLMATGGRGEQIIEAGLAQGRREAERVKPFWD